MAKQPKTVAARVAATTSSPPPAAPPAGDAAQGATEATASSLDVSGSATATGVGVTAPAGGGQPGTTKPGVLTLSAVEQAHAELHKAVKDSGEPLCLTGSVRFLGLDTSIQADQTGWFLQERPTFGSLGDPILERSVLVLGDGEPFTMGDLFDLPWRHQADVITLLVDAASRQVVLPTSADLMRDLDLIEAAPADRPDAPEGFVWIQGKSRDDKPFRRAGIAWDGNFQTHLVSDDDAFVIANDPHLIVRFL